MEQGRRRERGRARGAMARTPSAQALHPPPLLSSPPPHFHPPFSPAPIASSTHAAHSAFELSCQINRTASIVDGVEVGPRAFRHSRCPSSAASWMGWYPSCQQR
eukprot:2588979-Rhodomonas_salina.2